jgi:small-conductance mechanosensitive channel
MENKKNAKKVVGEIISHLLNVPVLAGALVTYLFFRLPESEPNRLSGYAWAMLFLCVVPLCSLFFYIPVRDENKHATVRRQRIASFVIMLVSYPVGWLILAWTGAPLIFTAVAAIYTFVTLGLFIFNLLLRYKASGHAAGVCGPIAAVIYIFGIAAIPLLLLLPLIIWARLAAEGHNFWQTIVGATMSALISIGVLWAFGFPPFRGVVL